MIAHLIFHEVLNFLDNGSSVKRKFVKLLPVASKEFLMFIMEMMFIG